MIIIIFKCTPIAVLLGVVDLKVSLKSNVYSMV